MSLEKYDDQCPGCRPAMIEMKTGRPLPDDSPEMKCLFAVWEETTLAEREAWHRVTCRNSRAEPDLFIASSLATRFEDALRAMSKG